MSLVSSYVGTRSSWLHSSSEMVSGATQRFFWLPHRCSRISLSLVKRPPSICSFLRGNTRGKNWRSLHRFLLWKAMESVEWAPKDDGAVGKILGCFLAYK